MASTVKEQGISRTGTPALVTRLFGWAVLTALFAFLVNNVLVVRFNYPGLRGLGGEASALAWVQVGIYAACLAVAVLIVLRSRDMSLRWDARRIHGFNVYLIRALFWTVLLVGCADVIIAFMRVEGLFLYFTNEESARAFGRANWVAPVIHLPLIALGFVIALFTRTLGFTWLALLIVVAELLIVISRFVFSYEQALMGDLVRYWYAALFLFSSAYTLFDDGHVRVDVLYAGFGPSTRGFVNAWGSILLGMTTAWVILAIGFNGKQSIINSPVMNFEVSQTGNVGMFIKYQMAAFLGLFAITMLIQFVSFFLESVADRRGEPGHHEAEATSH
jgi:TRAP-type mannitol/chloroaromatic compound transport system permease small subunit